MEQDPAFTAERINALNSVDLRIFGVIHGYTEYVDGLPHVRHIEDADFEGLSQAASELKAEHGDALGIEPTGFRSPDAQDMTLASILPATVPEGPVAEISPEDQDEIAAFLENSRANLRINNLVYVAAHTLLRGVPVYRAEVSAGEWETLQELLPKMAPPEDHKELGYFYRNTNMLSCLGDIAIDMTQLTRPDPVIKPVLLFASGRAHTPRLAQRLSGNGVSFTSNL